MSSTENFNGSCDQSSVVITYTFSRTKLSYNVITHARYQGHTLAKELAALNLQTTVITDSAVFAMISRVDMVRSHESSTN